MPYLQAAILCDTAREYDGKIFILGGFAEIVYAETLGGPCPVSFAGRIGFGHDELTTDHLITLVVKDPSDAEVARVDGQMGPQDASKLPVKELPGAINVITPLPFPLTTYGTYWVDLSVDGNLFVKLPLVVKEMPAV